MKRCACLGTLERSSVDLDCSVCFGSGLLWDDGKPLTACPGGSAYPVHGDPTRYPCGRKNEYCLGCDRHRDSIPNDDDIARTLERNRLRREAASDG